MKSKIRSKEVTFVVLFSIVSFVKTDQSIQSLPGTNKMKESNKWIWDIIEKNSTNESQAELKSMTQSEKTSDDVNPCNIPAAVQPNFSRPGLRISEEKCYEYLWHIHNKDIKLKNGVACLNYLGKGAGIGGRNTREGEFPHMGAIGWKAVVGDWVYKCGSSLISSKFVLTAAHCSKVSTRDTSVADPVPKKVKFGDKNLAKGKKAGAVISAGEDILRIIVHSQYASPLKYFDIALIELVKEVKFTDLIFPACLWTKPDTKNLGTKATSTGWGVTEIGGDTSNELQVVELSIIDKDKCDELLQPYYNRLLWSVEDTHICAGNLSGGVDTCQGDSGGPLQIKIHLPKPEFIPKSIQIQIYYLIGVTSFGIGCARSNTPGLYTRVSAFIDWIENIVWK